MTGVESTMLPWSNDAVALLGNPTVSMLTSILWDGLKLLILGSVIETARRIFYWVIDRFRLRWSISAEFEAGDISQEWVVNYLIKENIWRTPCNIFVKMKNNKRKWRLQTGTENDQVDFIPEYGFVQFFRWRGYWLEVSRLKDQFGTQSRYVRRHGPSHFGSQALFPSISLTLFTLDRSVLYRFVEECRLKYADDTKSEVTVYTAGGRDFLDRFPHISGWGNVKMMRRRPLDSLLIDKSAITSLLDDAREFLNEKDWYIKAGIPHRRGYLLHGPPGTGKTSTIYTMTNVQAGELGLEIYVLSLSSKSLDDTRLARLVSLLPMRGILVLEDIDCAFPSRSDWDEDEFKAKPWHIPNNPKTSQVTMSGLLNILDGIGSEDGKIFFATTNHIGRLDPALIRPGRIDRKIEYRLATQQQAHGLFLKFFPESMFPTVTSMIDGSLDTKESQNTTLRLANDFSSAIPPDEFSMAELQGYLLECKTAGPLAAARHIQAWVERECQAKRDIEAREQLRKAERRRQYTRRNRSSREKAISQSPMLTPNPGQGEDQPPEQLPPASALTENPDCLEML